MKWMIKYILLLQVSGSSCTMVITCTMVVTSSSLPLSLIVSLQNVTPYIPLLSSRWRENYFPRQWVTHWHFVNVRTLRADHTYTQGQSGTPKSYTSSTPVISFDRNRLEVSSSGFALTGLRAEMCNVPRTNRTKTNRCARPYLFEENILHFPMILQNCQKVISSYNVWML